MLVGGIFDPFGTGNGTVVRLYIGVQLAEAGKVGMFEKTGNSLLDLPKIELASKMVGVVV